MIYIHSLVTEFLHNLLKGTEVVNEAKCGGRNGIYVHVDIDEDRDFGDDIAYFKCTTTPNLSTAKDIARISFTAPKYIIHNNDRFKLNPRQKNTLVDLLVSTAKNGMTVWQFMIYRFNLELSNSNNPRAPKYKLPLELPIPDYTKL